MGIAYYVIDTETTGLNQSTNEIFELSIVRGDSKVQFTKQIKCENPWTASADALRITGKTIEDLQLGYPKEKVIEEAEEFFAEDNLTPSARCIVGHNISFDRRFLHSLWEEHGKAFPAEMWLDTMDLAKTFFKTYNTDNINIIKTATGKTSTQLVHCCEMLNVKRPKQLHSAKTDSQATYMLWQKLINDYKIDYLPHIKTVPHTVKNQELTDIEDLDLSEIY